MDFNLGTALGILMGILLHAPVCRAIACFVCSSVNGSDPMCRDPFDARMGEYYTQHCHQLKNNRKNQNKQLGRFPAKYCTKIKGVNSRTQVEIVVRSCDLEINFDNMCGMFRIEQDRYYGCLMHCKEPGCNSAPSLYTATPHPLLSYSSAAFIALFFPSFLCSGFSFSGFPLSGFPFSGFSGFPLFVGQAMSQFSVPVLLSQAVSSAASLFPVFRRQGRELSLLSFIRHPPGSDSLLWFLSVSVSFFCLCLSAFCATFYSLLSLVVQPFFLFFASLSTSCSVLYSKSAKIGWRLSPLRLPIQPSVLLTSSFVVWKFICDISSVLSTCKQRFLRRH